MRILNVAFPFAAVRPDAVGGAEQILATLDAAIVEAGHESLVLACAGSRVRGQLVSTEAIAGPIDDSRRQRAWARHAELIDRLVDSARVDVVHLHGLDFPHYLPATSIPVVATLHLPLDWYETDIAKLPVHLVCVSRSQRQRGGPAFSPVSIIENGVPLTPCLPCARQNFVLCLGRVCPEKGLHLAVHAARAARVPLLIAGQVFPYRAHQDYFERELSPLFDEQRRFIGPVTGALKRQLLASARCVLIPSLAPETSSLVAMEAIAAGTPVVARPVGALPEIVDHGRTGLLADDVAALAQALREIPRLPRSPIQRASARFDARTMAKRYLDLYRDLAVGRA
jgi:glycosyltransferase involved in cell wall biosynthesis